MELRICMDVNDMGAATARCCIGGDDRCYKIDSCPHPSIMGYRPFNQ